MARRSSDEIVGQNYKFFNHLCNVATTIQDSNLHRKLQQKNYLNVTSYFQFLKFIQQMCSILNIEAITADIGMDMSFESILSRCEQLIRAEYDWGEDKKLQLHNQTRKIKALKEQLQSKVTHNCLIYQSEQK